MISEGIFTNEGNLAFTVTNGEYNYIRLLYSLTENSITIKTFQGMYECVAKPKVKDTRYTIAYDYNDTLFFTIVKLKRTDLSIQFVLVVLNSIALKKIYGFDKKGKLMEEKRTVELLKVLANYYTGCRTVDDIKEKILLDISYNGFSIIETDIDYEKTTISLFPINPPRKDKKSSNVIEIEL